MEERSTRWISLAGVAVHIYTACGAILAMLTIMEAIRGNVVLALWYCFAAVFIDSTDGTLARRFRVSETVPWFDGRRLDDIVDYLTYVFAPILLLWQNNFLPAGTLGQIVAMIPLFASAYQFCRVDAKTDGYEIVAEDHFFLGFPSYWNIVAFYAVVMQLDATTVTTIILVCSILVFIPIRYVYPSRTVMFRRVTLLFTTLCSILYGVILWMMPEPQGWALNITLSYIVYYVALSLYLTYRILRPSVVVPT
jgi:phosphatidylcholine synthase